jgi:hypothetical protein
MEQGESLHSALENPTISNEEKHDKVDEMLSLNKIVIYSGFYRLGVL